MAHVVILGSSPAGAKLIEALRRVDSDDAVTLIALDGHYPYRREMFADFLAKAVPPEKVFYRTKDFYEKHRVELILDRKIARINVSRKRITLEDKRQIDYDMLVVTDTPENRYPEIKGTNKNCVYGYKKLKDIDAVAGTMSLIKTAVIQSSTFCGLQAASGFINSGKEVILAAPERSFLARYFSGEAAEWLKAEFEAKGLRVFDGNPIAEILGDKDAKAVRLHSGKVFSAEAILFMETVEDMRLFAGSVKGKDRFEVDGFFRASPEGVFAVDQTSVINGSEPITPLLDLEAQGELIAALIKGQEVTYEAPIKLWDFSVEGLSMTVMGDIDDEETVDNCEFDSVNKSLKNVFMKDGRVIGAIIVNRNEERDLLMESIRNKEIYASQAANLASEVMAEMSSQTIEINDEKVSTELIDN